MIHKIYDNEGMTLDRYTILTEPFHFGKSCNTFSFSENAKSAQGINNYCGDVYENAELGKEISFDDLPEEVKEALIERLET
jgi:hypothetical protein